jgi:ElaB/YqjD/DUF883 family membrane-anchored ribosome-binding protein
MAERNNLTSASSPWQRQAQDTISGAERSAEEIRQDIAARRESITDTVDRLSDRFQETLDWKAYVSDYPLAALGVAAGLGFLASRIFKPRRSAGRRIKDALAYGLEDLTGRFHNQLENVAPHRSGLGLGKTVKAAMAGLITKAATDYLQNKFVGRFAGHYEQYPENELEYDPKYERDSELFR